LVAATARSEIVIWWAPIPGTPQEGFFDDDTPDANVAFIGGYAAGKTMTLAGKMLKLSAMNAPLPILWVVPDYAHIHDTILPTIESIDPETGHAWFLTPDQFHFHETRHVLTWDGGGPILFLTAENPKSIAGPNVAAAGMDEPGSVKRAAWRNTVARVRHPGAKLRQKIAAGTPEGLNWFAELFNDPERPENCRVYKMRTEQNSELLKGHPQYLEQIRENATDAELQAYLGGQFVSMDGPLAYPMFDEATHWRTGIAFDRAQPLLLTFDFNVNPMVCLVCQYGMGPAGRELYVLDAVVEYKSTVDATCDEFLSRYPTWKPGMFVYGDATGKNASVNNLKGNYEIIRTRLAVAGRVEIKVGLSNPPVSDRLSATNRLLKDARGAHRLFISKTIPGRTCKTREVVRSLQQSVKKPGTDDLWKKPGETITHAGDALGYLVHAEFPIRKRTGAGFLDVPGL
jgi:hypothetical protein